jgi:hypothetical protein
MLSLIAAVSVLRHFTSSGGLVTTTHSWWSTAREAQELDAEGKGGGLVDGMLVREFPDRN